MIEKCDTEVQYDRLELMNLIIAEREGNISIDQSLSFVLSRACC